MSENSLKTRRRTRSHFVISCFTSVLADRRLHDRWWHADTLVDEINTRCRLADDAQVQKQELLRIVSKAYGSKSSAGNVFVVNNQQFILYRHDFSKKEEGKTKKHDFFHVTSSKNVPVFPTLKKPLTKDKSPFLHYFDYGENKEGYWDYNHMVLQFEDVVDCLKVMHPNFHFVFLFDHSLGHAKQRPDGLSATKMNKSFSGKSPPM